MTHAGRGHQCEFCPRVAFGNGGRVSHARAHVARGEAVEMVKHYPIYPPMVSRIFVAATDVEAIGRLTNSGFERVQSNRGAALPERPDHHQARTSPDAVKTQETP